jgi:glutamine synthetase
MLTTPTINGYKRYRPHAVAPDRVAWSRQHRGAMVRVIGEAGEPATHLENRVGDPAANPHLYVAAQLVCGVDGLRRRLEPPPATLSPYEEAAGPLLPRSLGEAIAAFEASSLYRSVWGAEVVDYLLTVKRSEWNRFQSAVTDWELREYDRLL